MLKLTIATGFLGSVLGFVLSSTACCFFNFFVAGGAATTGLGGIVGTTGIILGR
jgi:hypothetical protein